MNIVNEASKLFTNKYFLYFMVFLASTNMLGYLIMNNIKAIIFFILVGLITSKFSKNMSIVLLVSVLMTNFLMANKLIREGLENETSQALSNIEDKDPEIASTIPAVKKAKNNEDVSSQLDNIKLSEKNEKIVDPNNLDKNEKTDDGKVKGVGEKLGGKKNVSNNVNPRLDYAATIEESYANLDQLLGSDSIKQLTNDTQKLMKQQQNLFDTMQNMVPVLEGAQNLLKDFKIEGLTNSLKNMGGISKIATV